MKPIVPCEILALEQWERVRRVLRPLCMNEKERRRLAVGSHITVLFENVQTVWYQIQEMLRAERIEKPDALQEEIDIYNPLLPAPGELAATILIAYSHQEQRDALLPGLVGLERQLWLDAGQHRISAKFDDNESNPGEISAGDANRGGHDQRCHGPSGGTNRGFVILAKLLKGAPVSAPTSRLDMSWNTFLELPPL